MSRDLGHPAVPVSVRKAGIGSSDAVTVCAECHIPVRTAYGLSAVHTAPPSRWCGPDCERHAAEDAYNRAEDARITSKIRETYPGLAETFDACPDCGHRAHRSGKYGGGGCNGIIDSGWTWHGCHCTTGPDTEGEDR